MGSLSEKPESAVLYEVTRADRPKLGAREFTVSYEAQPSADARTYDLATSPSGRLFLAERVLGFRCELIANHLRKAVGEVLSTIRDNYPSDLTWLERVLVKFAPHQSPRAGDLGECIYVNADATPEEFFASDDREAFESQRAVLLVEQSIDPAYSKAVVAHELGHAFGTDHQRACAYDAVVADPEWAGEAVADLYALRWGFEAELRAHESMRHRGHHRLQVDDLLPFVGLLDDWQDGDDLLRFDSRLTFPPE